MLFKNYLETVLGSKVKVGIIRALLKFPEKNFTARELANFIDVSHTPVLISLNDLVGMNIIEVEKYGASKLIRLNKYSYLYEPLKQLFKYEHHTIEKLVYGIRKITSEAETIILFGSIVKGKERMNSDIDLLIVTKSVRKVKQAITEKQKTIIRKFGNVLSPIVLTEKQFINKKNKPFAKDLLKGYILISGRDLIKKYWK